MPGPNSKKNYQSISRMLNAFGNSINNSKEKTNWDETLKQGNMKPSIIRDSTDASILEAYRILQVNIDMALHGISSKRIIITSALPNEGKTTSCCNLGITLAQTGIRVLLIDCDLRRPALHKEMMLNQSPGLSEILTKKASLNEALQVTEHPNLTAVCAGESPRNAIELLREKDMKISIDELSKNYEYIIIDMPPVNLVADVAIVSKLADGIVLVVREGETKHREFERAVTSLEYTDSKIIGVILNDVNINRIYGTRYEYKKYNKYYR